jgi:hypothetical protein
VLSRDHEWSFAAPYAFVQSDPKDRAYETRD